MEEWQIDYEWYLSEFSGLPYEVMVENLIEDFKLEWAYHYRNHKSKFEIPHDVVIITLGTFEYLYDSQYFRDNDLDIEPRVVVAYGRTNTQPSKRDDARLKYLFGATEKRFGSGWDKGHFIANSMGGRVVKHEINVFPQERKLNRGWSIEGKIYRRMEKYCSSQDGVFCFHRPIHQDLALTPKYLEFGILLPDSTLWIELFKNQL